MRFWKLNFFYTRVIYIIDSISFLIRLIHYDSLMISGQSLESKMKH